MDNPNPARPWYDIVQATLKRNDVKLVTYVPDNVFTPLIKNLHADSDFLTFATAREEEALGILSGAWMGGRRGAVLMQTSGFDTIPNVLASLVVPYQILVGADLLQHFENAIDRIDAALPALSQRGREQSPLLKK